MVDETGLPPSKSTLKLTVIVKARDSFEGKPVVDVLLSLYKRAGISGATVTHAARGYGVRGVARADVLGLSVNLPTIIETVADERGLARYSRRSRGWSEQRVDYNHRS
jgi:PII-like signaling protein